MRASRLLTSGSEMLRERWSVVLAFLKFFTAKYAKTAKIILCVSSAFFTIMTLSLVQRPNDINYEYRTDISGNNMIEDTYSVVCKLETQLIIKPRIIIQEESRGKVNE